MWGAGHSQGSGLGKTVIVYVVFGGVNRVRVPAIAAATEQTSLPKHARTARSLTNA